MSVAEIGQLHGRYVRLSDEFKAIWTYNQFAAGVYKSFLHAPLPYRVDFQKLYENIRASSDLIQSSNPQNAVPILERCERELNTITRLLVGADDGVKPSVLRRFLEKLKQQDEKIIFNLIKFYLYADAVEGDPRDKIDFLFTKIGEDFVEARGEYWSKDSLELRKQFVSLLAIRPVREVDQKEIIILIRSIRENKEEIQQVDSFDRLSELNLLEKLRKFKHRIGELYFHPDVLLAIVDCNVTMKNRFQKLFREEEQRIIDDSQRLFAEEDAITRSLGATNPSIRDEMERFRRFKQEFDESRANSNLKYTVITQLKNSIATILQQIDRGLDERAPEEVPTTFLLEVQQNEAVQSRFGNDPLLHRKLVHLLTVLDAVDPHLGEERIAREPIVNQLRLEPWEVLAYLKLFTGHPLTADDTEELLLLYLRAAALRLSIEDQAKILSAVPEGDPPEDSFLKTISETLDRAKEYDQLFGDFLHEGIYYSDPDILHKLYRSRFRLVRSFSGLWLLYDTKT